MAEKKFLDFLDRFDGGGMGKSGEKFEGGGLLSMLGNLFADPYGSDDKARMASRDAFYNAQGDAVPAPSLLSPRAGGRTAPSAPTPVAQTAPGAPIPTPHSSIKMYGQGSGMPNTDMTAIPGYTTPVSDMPNTGMTAIPGYTTPASDGSPIEQLSQEQVYAKFGEDMSQKFGGSQANAIMSSPNGLAVFNDYVRNGYRLPDM